MNKEKLSWGLILLFAGVIILLNNLHVINFYWRSVFSLWPVILIIIGVNLLVPRRGTGNAISILVTLTALAFLAYRGTFPPRSDWWVFNNKSWKTEERVSRVRRNVSEDYFYHDYTDTIRVANLTLKGGAIEYGIDDTSGKLFEAETKSNFGKHILETSESTKDGERTVDLTFKMENTRKGNFEIDGGENTAKIKLNTNPVWNINLDFGAGAADFDLSKHKIALLNIKGGAMSFETKLGMPLSETVINVESGAASVEIEIPKAAACKINVKSGLSSRSFPGFTKDTDGSYITEGYDSASQKFTINLKGGLSSFVVERY